MRCAVERSILLGYCSASRDSAERLKISEHDGRAHDPSVHCPAIHDHPIPLLMTLRTIHVLMRFNDRLFGIGNVIERHSAVLEKRGAVWLAKIGRPLGSGRMDQINEQVGDGVASHLFLAQKKAGKYEVWRSAILEVRSELPRSGKSYVPAYYHKLEGFANAETWFKVGSFARTEPDDLRYVVTLSSNEPVMRTLASSMAGLFIVGESDTAESSPHATQSVVTRRLRVQAWDSDNDDEAFVTNDDGEMMD